MQMSWDIVNSINDQIPDEEDVVLWNLGDLFYGKLFTNQTLAHLAMFIEKMKGKHRTLNIVLGNHDKQFKKFADWSNFAPLTKTSSFSHIFSMLGFTNVYNHPILWNDKIILSHEPFFLKRNSQFVNVHGHTHQMNIDENYFTYDLENYKMVRKAYKDSGREVPPLTKKKDWQRWIVDPKKYRNICWDCPDARYRVLDLNKLTKEI